MKNKSTYHKTLAARRAKYWPNDVPVSIAPYFVGTHWNGRFIAAAIGKGAKEAAYAQAAKVGGLGLQLTEKEFFQLIKRQSVGIK